MINKTTALMLLILGGLIIYGGLDVASIFSFQGDRIKCDSNSDSLVWSCDVDSLARLPININTASIDLEINKVDGEGNWKGETLVNMAGKHNQEYLNFLDETNYITSLSLGRRRYLMKPNLELGYDGARADNLKIKEKYNDFKISIGGGGIDLYVEDLALDTFPNALMSMNVNIKEKETNKLVSTQKLYGYCDTEKEKCIVINTIDYRAFNKSIERYIVESNGIQIIFKDGLFTDQEIARFLNKATPITEEVKEELKPIIVLDVPTQEEIDEVEPVNTETTETTETDQETTTATTETSLSSSDSTTSIGIGAKINNFFDNLFATIKGWFS